MGKETLALFQLGLGPGLEVESLRLEFGRVLLSHLDLGRDVLQDSPGHVEKGKTFRHGFGEPLRLTETEGDGGGNGGEKPFLIHVGLEGGSFPVTLQPVTG